jgi:hypothetical protein
LISDSGAKIIAQVALARGVYLDEEYGMHFNVDVPGRSRIRKEGFCAEILGFHGLGPREMEDVGNRLSGIEDVLRWSKLLGVFAEPSSIEDGEVRMRKETGFRRGRDYVGEMDDHITTFDVDEAKDCEKKCEKWQKCLTWKWERGKCWIAPWITVGKEVGEETLSGIHVARLRKLEGLCAS